MHTIIALLLALAAPTYVPAPTVPPCIEEDGSGQAVCYWDGATRGNGHGESYLVINL